jgi:cytochrome c-type biogenesis protein CcmH
MMPLFVAAGALTFAVILLLITPLARRRRAAAPRQAYDLAVLVQQLAEVDRDAARGLLDDAEAEAARIELKRRILGAAEAATPPEPAAADAAAPAMAANPPPNRSRWTAAPIALLVPLVAIAVYLAVGQPGTPDRPLAARLADGDLAERSASASEDRASLEQTVDQLQRFLRDRPNEAEGWLLLGRARLTLDQPMEAIAALQRAYMVAPERSDIGGALGEAIVIGAGGEVTDAARSVLAAALAADPRNIQARYYLALGEAQRGESRQAIQGWVDLLALSPAGAPWLAQVEAQIAAAAAELGIDRATLQPRPEVLALVRQAPSEGPDAERPAEASGRSAARSTGPSGADVEAAARLTAAEREQMIRAMVARLAERLQAYPDDADGWLRLARAYDVLGEPGKAADARARAEQVQRR